MPFSPAFRRLALRTAFALALFLFGFPAGGVRAAQSVTLMLNWLPGGVHVPFYYAQEAGFYRRAGLDVHILSSRGSRAALTAVRDGKADFALAEAAELFAFRTGEQDALGVMVYLARSPLAILALDRPDLRALSDLNGKRLAAPKASFPRVLFPQLAKAAGIKLATLHWLDLTPGELLPALVEGRADAVASSSLVAYPYREAARRKGKNIRIFPYAEAGVNPYSLVLTSTDTFLAKEPRRAKAFVRATVQAVAAALENPRQAFRVFFKMNPTLGEKRLGAEWRAALPLIYPAEARRAGLGHFQQERLQQMRQMLAQVRNLSTGIPLERFYTNDLVPNLRPRPAGSF